MLKNCFSARDLKTNGVLVDVRIIEYLPPGKAMSYANYRCEFIYKGEMKKLVSSSNVKYRREFYVGQNFPAMYSEKYDVVRVLMKSEDFEEFNLPFPDSLIYRVIDMPSQ
jgi:translation elongation factor P/translation initiation factor 5A